MSDKTKKSDPKLMKKIYVSVSLLLIAVILMIAVSYAWIALSTAPEVIGVNTSITGNGSLEIALMPSTGLFSGITSGRGASADYAGGVQELTKANNSWGNIINLNDTVYGLDLITLRPARLNYDPQTGFVGDSILSTPEWSADGRITALRGTLTASHYTDDDFAVGPGFSGDRYGVRAVLDVDNDTYGFITDLAFRINTESELGQAGKLLLQTYGAQRIYSGSDEEATLGKGSCFSFIDEFGNDIENYSKTYAKKYLECLRLAFIRDYGNAEADESSVIAFARANTESGELYICDKNGSIIKGEDANVIIPAMEKNRAYQVSVLVWLDGNAVTSANMTVSQRILNKASLNLQFSTDIELVPAENSNIVSGDRIVLDSGELGENAEWELDNRGLLDITGSGSIGGYGADELPWIDKLNVIKEINVSSGIREILENTFINSKNLTKVTLPAGITGIGNDAFAGCAKLSEVYFDGTVADWTALEKGEGNEYLTDAVIYCTDGTLNEPDNTIYGDCGENASFAITEDGLLTVSGTGAIADYETEGSPWYTERSHIKGIEIKSGITGIGAYAFEGCEELVSITIPATVETVGENAFDGCTELYEINYAGTAAKWNTLTPASGNAPLANAVVRCEDNTLNEPRVIARGECGEHIAWTLDENGLLAITGTGAMADYENGETPWYANIDSIEKVVMSGGITSIGNGAFYGAGNLTKATVSLNTESIGDYAFAGCALLENVNIPSTVNSIGAHAFEGCVLIDGITVPSGVSAIGDYAFAGCTAIGSVSIPSSVTTLGAYAFSGCTALDSVNLPSSVTAIGANAFENCTELNYIALPYGVTEIGDGAFSGSGLSAATIPATVTAIGDGAFDNCENLTVVNFAGTLAQWNAIETGENTGALATAAIYCSDGNANVPAAVHSGTCGDNVKWTLDNNGTLTIYGTGAMDDFTYTTVTVDNVPKTVWSAPWSQYAASITNVTISAGVTRISDNAFSSCLNIQSVSIPETLTGIGANAFNNCNDLSSVYITDLAKWCGISFVRTSYGYYYNGYDRYIYYSNPLYGGADLYLNGEKVTELVIPDGVTAISAGAFSGCTGITSVTIPVNVKSIGDSAFSGCAELVSADLGNGLESAGMFAFGSCYKLADVTVGSGMKSFGANAFLGCYELKRVYINDLANWCGIEFVNIYSNPLYYAGNLYLDGTLVRYNLVIPEGVTEIKPYTFCNYNKVTDLFIPANMNFIAANAFLYMDLDTVSVAAENDRYKSVANCLIDTYSKSIILGTNNSVIPTDENITRISIAAFAECSKLSDITIPGNIRIIYEHAFSDCVGLKTVKILEGVNEIGSYAFYGCTGLTSVTVLEGVTSIGSYAFYGCSGLTSITIPDSVTSIGEYAFSGCSSLTSVTLPEGVTSIENGTFGGCTGLTNVDIPCSVTSIGTGAFENCSSLEYIVIPDSVTSIIGGYYSTVLNKNYFGAFHGCGSLKTVYFGSGISSIGYLTFSDCDSLTDVYYNGTASQWNYVDIDTHYYKWEIIKDNEGHPQQDIDGNNIYEVIDYEGTGNVELLTANIHYGTFSGMCGDNASWSIDENGVLTIKGRGELYDYYSGTRPYAPVIGNVRNVVIGAGITSVGAYMFTSFPELVSVQLPEGIVSIGDAAFAYCPKLASVNIPSTAVSIGSSAFAESPLITEITLPAGLETIGASAFSGCTGITSVNIPDSVTGLGASAFYNCSSVETAYIGSGVEKIPNNAFYGCTGLTSINIPDSVTSIGQYAFASCSGLTSVTIGSGVTSIGEYAFSSCSGLTSINYNGTKVQWNALSKGLAWNNNTYNYTVCCTDGNIPKQ